MGSSKQFSRDPLVELELHGDNKGEGGIGFREFHSFNKALLAKQLWHLWQTPNSLIEKIMKAKYYPNCQAIHAQLDNKPSFAQRSIHRSKDLLNEGLMWRIGNREKARIWGDKWVPIPSSYKIYYIHELTSPEERVSMLIDKDLTRWERNKLEDLFAVEEFEAIVCIPLSCTNQEDRMIWRGSTNGIFFVKSTYHLAKDMEDRAMAGSSKGALNNDVWMKIWHLKVPNSEEIYIYMASES